MTLDNLTPDEIRKRVAKGDSKVIDALIADAAKAKQQSLTEAEIKARVENGDEDAINIRRESGRQAAQNDSQDGKLAVDKKPTGQTSAQVYPYTYFWVEGYNEYVDSITKE